jgi:predicted transcriptional regulator
MIKDELNLYQIILSLKRKPYSLEGLANKLNISKEETQKHISLLTKKGLVTLKQTIPTTIYAIVAHEKNP